jgi:hypothetical protein
VADFQLPNEDGYISVTDDDGDNHEDEDYTDEMPTNLESTLNQEHTVTVVLGLAGMANAIAKDNDGAMNDQENAT